MRGSIRTKRRWNADKGETEHEKEYFLDGKRVSEEEFNAALPDKPLGGAPGAQATWNKPILSDGLAVVPKRIKEAEAKCLKHGVPTDFTTDGRPVLRTRAHRKAYLKAYGYHDNDGGYGD